MKIIAFDSSLQRSAWASFNGEDYEWDARSFIKPKDKDFPDARFSEWRKWADAALAWHEPELCVMEVATTHGQGSGAPQIMLMMTLRELCAVRKIPVVSIYPTHLKAHTCGNGKADKAQMMQAVAVRVPEYSGVEDVGSDIADSLAMLLWFQDAMPPSAAALRRLAKQQNGTKAAQKRRAKKESK